ncbi:MAG TPA: radical SAM protein [Candidatus Brocadiia bacterium]|nr:radical SAM protein [Candidatus Brocadiia bacterium]
MKRNQPVRIEAASRPAGGEAAGYTDRLSKALSGGGPVPNPLVCFVVGTGRCNSRCLYCPAWDHPAGDIDAPMLCRALREFAQMGGRVVGISGGEPTLCGGMAEIIRTCAETGLYSIIVTNGAFDAVDRLEELLDAGLNAIEVSVDTLDPVKYKRIRGIEMDGVMKTLAALEKWRNEGRVWGLLTSTLSAANAPDILPLLDYARARSWQMTWHPLKLVRGIEDRIMELWPSEDVIREIENNLSLVIESDPDDVLLYADKTLLRHAGDALRSRRLRLSPCMAGWTEVDIALSGDVRACCSMPPVGNLRKAGLREIWNSRRMGLARAMTKRGLCPGCWYSGQITEAMFWQRRMGLDVEDCIRGLPKRG